jgi:SAM-dependent methyltransferase
MIRTCPWIDTRARFISGVERGGALLDLGSSDGETLRHMAELRPDLRFTAADIQPQSRDGYPAGAAVVSLDVTRDRFPWPDDSFDAISCFQLIEHLPDISCVLYEAARVLKPGGRLMIETPQPWTVKLPPTDGKFTYSFYDDPSHIRPWSVKEICSAAADVGLSAGRHGVSRNLLFAAAWPVYLLLPFSRKKMTSKIHWMGWSAYVLLVKEKNS